ncbi:glucose-6-phosphate dehydrogenase [Carnimonas nigrificans]|uniref:glucose-6-phosphate dehydrogenase n=1 Tax=Carnimonas nigrificans TaxID=64323 RepID=UPI00046EF2A6|nr:glucose-6-phosphate dehydrogenase [Carnimonas nigrificans]
MAVEQTPAVDVALFGALGDLAVRKLYAAMYFLEHGGLLADNTRILGLARHEHDAASFTQLVSDALHKHVDKKSLDDTVLERFLARLDYLKLDFSDTKGYTAITKWNKDSGSPLMVYLSVPASIFGVICENLDKSKALNEESRVIVEKPIGYDLETSIETNDAIGKVFAENQIYRIDHYLGKETVQNLLALRFANPLFGNQWSQANISHVEITVAETVGVEGRWGYYDQAGQVRDMLQNHLMQLLCMIAMEPPTSLDADSIRNEKVKVLKALRPIEGERLATDVVRGQYTEGTSGGKQVPGYLDEEGANVNSHTETFVALKAEVANWRWAGVPFYLRTGKRMSERLAQIVIHFRQQPHYIFDPDQRGLATNKLVIRLQPDEGINLQILTKDSGLDKGMRLRPGPLDLDFHKAFPTERIPDAYERLILEVMKGRQYLFVRRDEVEWSWRWVDKLIDGWTSRGVPPQRYPAGSWGPVSSIAMITRDGYSWYEEY